MSGTCKEIGGWEGDGVGGGEGGQPEASYTLRQYCLD